MDGDDLDSGAPAALTETESTELAALENEMSDTRGKSVAHWRDSYWHNESKQQRYRELSERQASKAEPPANDPADVKRAVDVLGLHDAGSFEFIDARIGQIEGALLPAELDALNNAGADLSVRAKQGMLAALAEPHRRREFFDRLGSEDQRAVNGFLGRLSAKQMAAVKNAMGIKGF